MEYLTVKEENSDQFVEKKSRFIGTCRPVKTEEEALDFIARMKSEVLGRQPQRVRLHPAGERGAALLRRRGAPGHRGHPGDGHPEKGRAW